DRARSRAARCRAAEPETLARRRSLAVRALAPALDPRADDAAGRRAGARAAPVRAPTRLAETRDGCACTQARPHRATRSACVELVNVARPERCTAARWSGALNVYMWFRAYGGTTTSARRARLRYNSAIRPPASISAGAARRP